ncbi:hypothetical protein FA95DRAFT_1373932 [Auriscalpium vulgare]|uniref:Uncharacterized protein n=1 Tax=Auriscalpium vulgare TaxID=40419 RepID=A0ACB8R100_9AGAM|nr:hypothetical protein FA95DRAFT_1373932 [Auriscalpium vulgare]
MTRDTMCALICLAPHCEAIVAEFFHFRQVNRHTIPEIAASHRSVPTTRLVAPNVCRIGIRFPTVGVAQNTHTIGIIPWTPRSDQQLRRTQHTQSSNHSLIVLTATTQPQAQHLPQLSQLVGIPSDVSIVEIVVRTRAPRLSNNSATAKYPHSCAIVLQPLSSSALELVPHLSDPNCSVVVSAL